MAAVTVNQQQIELDMMPVINLTRRPRGSTSLQSVPSVSSEGGDNRGQGGPGDDGDGEGGGDSRGQGGPGDDGEGGGDGVINYRKVVPRPGDEPSVVCLLSGYSVSGYTELCGWSLMTPLKFVNISDTTRFRTVTDGRGDVVEEADDLLKNRITLRQMEGLIGSPNAEINCPVFVHVVAKRKVDLVPIRNRLLVIPLVVIADNSGYCVLCSMNEGWATIYNKVEVGDLLLISHCRPQKPRRTYHRGLFPDDMFLDLELKVQFHSVRNHYIERFTPLQLAKFRMPEALFHVDPNSTTTKDIKLPSTLEREFLQCSTTKRPTYSIPQNTKQYYDLVGVVTYVGRIERFQYKDAIILDTLQNRLPIPPKAFSRFKLFRWIYLADLHTSGCGFPVKVFVNKATLDQQADLVPGAILALTHCVTYNCAFTGSHTMTSAYSQLYMHRNLEKYCMLHPPNFRDITTVIMNRNNYVEIIRRKDVQFMVGGSHQLKIVNEEKFKEFYADNSVKKLKDLRDKPMRRRESRRLYFEGEILRVIEVGNDGILKVHRPVGRYQVEKERKEEYHKIENFSSYRQHGNTSWFAFQRKLPEVDGAVLRLPRCRDIYGRVVGGWKGYLGVLGMPAEYDGEVQKGYKEDEMPEMGKLERVDGPPYLMLDVVNSEEKIWYGVMWKGRGIGWEEKLRRVRDAMGKKVRGIVEVYCTEVDSPLEVNLWDFVVVEE